MNPIYLYFQKISNGNHFSTLKKGHKSHNNWWILPYLVPDLYFMIIYLYINHESNNTNLSKNIKGKTFFEDVKRAITLI